MGLSIGKIFNAAAPVLDYFQQEQNQRQAKHQFNVNQNESIQNRVADARKAGVHPLFALGASVGTSPTAHMPDSGTVGRSLRTAGQNITANKRNKTQDALENARADKLVDAQSQAALASASRDEALAAKTLSDLARAEQNTASIGRDVLGVQDDPIMGLHEVVPPQIPTARPGNKGVEGGQGPAGKRITRKDGRYYEIFGEAAQADEINQALIVQQAAKHFTSDMFTQLKRDLKEFKIWIKAKTSKLGNRMKRTY